MRRKIPVVVVLAIAAHGCGPLAAQPPARDSAGSVAASALSAQQPPQAVTTPAQHFGHEVGADYQLPDWAQISSYYELLAQQSPRVLLENLGTTTEGRDFPLAIISSEANLARLDEIRGYAGIIADPRNKTDQQKREAIERGRVILFISPAMHSTETAGTQFAAELAHLLATSDEEPWRSARERVVVCIFPCTNPDGLDHVSHWYRQTLETPFEAAEMLKLYQFYSGHDNNRDWFMLTQAETRLVTEQLYARWFPQVYWDVHQQGSRAERMFVPPFRDPLNANLDPAIVAGIDAIGSRALLDMTRDGFTGVSTGVTYDMWWNGGNRNVPVRHNIIGLLTEAASVRIASPLFFSHNELRAPGGLDTGYAPSNQFPAPWPGGWWRMRDIIDYEVSFGRSLLATLAREPQLWLRNCMEAAQREIDAVSERTADPAAAGDSGSHAASAGAPRAWIIPSDNRDPAAVLRLVDVLLRSGVEVHVADAAIEADGRRYPAGSIVIHRAQPYGAHVKDLLEVQRYPGGKPPYDVAGWTLPYLLGVRRVEVMQSLANADGSGSGNGDRAAALRLVARAEDALGGFGGDPRLADLSPPHLSTAHSDCWRQIVERLRSGEALALLTDGDRAGLVAPVAAADVEPHHRRAASRLPRIGVYAPWEGEMDEGWLRYAFDSSGVPFISVRNEMLRAGALGDFIDVLVIPSIGAAALDQGRAPGTIHDQYAGGLAPEGAVAVEEFVRTGGTLITLAASSQWAIDLLQLPLIDVTRLPDNRDFSCPGSVLRGVPASHAALAAGLPESIGVFFSGSHAWREMNEQERKDHRRTIVGAGSGDRAASSATSTAGAAAPMTTLMRYAPTRVLLSGWINKPEVIEGHAAWVRAEHGRGRVHLFGFRPQYRGWSQGTFGLIFRACIFDAVRPE